MTGSETDYDKAFARVLWVAVAFALTLGCIAIWAVIRWIKKL